MNSFLYDLKGQATVINGLIILSTVAFVFSRYRKRKTAKVILGVVVFVFLLCSTAYLPKYLADKLERRYPAYNFSFNDDTAKTLIHVLGSGYVLDKRLPPNSQLGLVALGRLAEGIRIHRLIKNSIIICSGNSPDGVETQAQVTKKAAIVLGVEESTLVTLDLPGTTQEEVQSLGLLYDTTTKLIVVTDALHMRRAIKLFKLKGFDPVAAPTNYKVNEGPGTQGIKWWPSYGNIGLMNYLIHEYLGNLKISLAG